MDCRIQAWLDVFQAGGVVIASIIAICGINGWRKEMREKREAELAEEVLVCVYECRDAIRAIRSPFVYSGEGKSREKGEFETQEQSKALDDAYVFYERYEQRILVFNRLNSLKYRFMVLVGPESQNLFDEMNLIAKQIVFSAREMAEYWSPGFESDDYVKKRKKELKRMFFESYGDNDELGNQLEQLVAKFEFECKKLLRVKSP